MKKNKKRKWILPVGAVCLFSIASGACAAESENMLKEAEIHVFIAASLENAFKDIIAVYQEKQPEITIVYNADSSGILQNQIEEGYECDLFFSADVKQMEILEQEGFVQEGTRRDLLCNEVVLISAKGSGTKVTGLDNLDQAESMALADGSVPVGKYTREALVRSGILDTAEEAAEISTGEIMDILGIEINECSNVSKVKEAVKEGSCEIGTVYYTDAYSVKEDVDILEHISQDLTGKIIYPMARTVNEEAEEAQKRAADDFYQFLQSDEVMDIFEEYLYLPYQEE